MLAPHSHFSPELILAVDCSLARQRRNQTVKVGTHSRQQATSQRMPRQAASVHRRPTVKSEGHSLCAHIIDAIHKHPALVSSAAALPPPFVDHHKQHHLDYPRMRSNTGTMQSTETASMVSRLDERRRSGRCATYMVPESPSSAVQPLRQHPILSTRLHRPPSSQLTPHPVQAANLYEEASSNGGSRPMRQLSMPHCPIPYQPLSGTSPAVDINVQQERITQPARPRPLPPTPVHPAVQHASRSMSLPGPVHAFEATPRVDTDEQAPSTRNYPQELAVSQAHHPVAASGALSAVMSSDNPYGMPRYLSPQTREMCQAVKSGRQLALRQQSTSDSRTNPDTTVSQQTPHSRVQDQTTWRPWYQNSLVNLGEQPMPPQGSVQATPRCKGRSKSALSSAWHRPGLWLRVGALLLASIAMPLFLSILLQLESDLMAHALNIHFSILRFLTAVACTSLLHTTCVLPLHIWRAPPYTYCALTALDAAMMLLWLVVGFLGFNPTDADNNPRTYMCATARTIAHSSGPTDGALLDYAGMCTRIKAGTVVSFLLASLYILLLGSSLLHIRRSRLHQYIVRS